MPCYRMGRAWLAMEYASTDVLAALDDRTKRVNMRQQNKNKARLEEPMWSEDKVLTSTTMFQKSLTTYYKSVTKLVITPHTGCGLTMSVTWCL